MMMKFWNAEIWSNFSAQIAATNPSVPSIALPSRANPSAQAGWGITSSEGKKNSVTAKTPRPTTMPRTIAPMTYAPKSSSGESGGSRMKIRLPFIFDCISDDDVLANAFWSTDIMTSPGTRNAVYETFPPNTETLDSSTCEKMSRYSSAVNTGARIVWKLTFQNRSSSL